jgi:hypothetical protein
MSLSGHQDGDRLFNNADSFAQAFDGAWQLHSQRHPQHGLPASDKLTLILAELAEHPFHQSQPELAEQVAQFRLRLLGL